MPAKPAKITPAICRVAACKAKRRKSAKARAITAKKEGLRRSKCTISGDAGRYTTNSSFTANKDNNNAYNRAYMPPANTEEEEEGSSGNNNSVNSGTSDSADKGKGSSAYKRSKGALRYEDTLLYKRHSALARPIIVRYLKVLIASKPTSASTVYYVLILPSGGKEEVDLAGIEKKAL
ncbi:hypothetical protein P8C59_003659 [Phyllachora maydis]|uniref:Uncharacterized protein n=1 Tax=Phyllachora maydis TaxID=1825666 RepID=A0AAD9I2F7_9PEZI|nr:hypothetical protein P8C59_003659 [Phyllachora maydis]